jgi:WhiB family transcriptional regulator, redox-sensing transcriptional regulator
VRGETLQTTEAIAEFAQQPEVQQSRIPKIELRDLERTHYGPESSTRDSFMNYGNCLGVDEELFFPERGASTRAAKEVCRGCVVREDCLDYALDNNEKFGIWGGLSERERRRIRRQRNIARRALNASLESN